MTKEPIAICISDIHFNINTLSLASKALREALLKAEELGIPLVIAGDLHDTKAIIRAEVMNEIIDILRLALVPVYLLEGNHDKINEKSVGHGLTYLNTSVEVIDYVGVHRLMHTPVGFIPYNQPEAVLKAIDSLKGKANILIMHQGFQGAAMGDYVLDKTSISPDAVKDFKVISGHYHRHQTLGTVTYIGSPYTITFGEHNDGPKGYLTLYSDGSYIQTPINLRKHIVLQANVHENGFDIHADMRLRINPEDLLWFKAKGPYSLLKRLNKDKVGNLLIGHSNFKLDLIPTSQDDVVKEEKNLTDQEVMDLIIDQSTDTDSQKIYLKQLWRELI